MTFLELEWYWWLVIAVLLAAVLPLKIKFLKWWGKRQRDEKSRQHGRWGDDE